MDKIMYYSLLYDFYSDLLTDKQRLFYEMYHLNDLSLNEVAEQYNISPQAVRDMVKRTEKILETYEEKLLLIKKYNFQKERILKIEQYIEINFTSENSFALKSMLKEILDFA